jgi:DNA modification methylase
MSNSNYELKEQFVIEKRVGVAIITSRPYDHYPTGKEIIEYLATLAPSNRSGVRVCKEHVLVNLLTVNISADLHRMARLNAIWKNFGRKRLGRMTSYSRSYSA